MAAYPMHDEATKLAYKTLRLYIGNALTPFATLESWQKHHCFFVDTATCRRDRLAWIDWMLGEEKESAKRYQIVTKEFIAKVEVIRWL